VANFIGRIPVVAVAVWFIACADPCENRVLSEVPAPRSNNVAIVFERSCGATTGFSTHVSILREFGEPWKSAGNVFTADSDHGAVKDMIVTVRWLRPDQIVIRYPAQARVFKREAWANGVEVAYETVQ
jgi:hypothetical protein